MREGKNSSDGTDCDFQIAIEVAESLTVRRESGGEINFGQRKSEALLVLLALAPKRRRTRAWLRERLWARGEPKQQMDSLRQCLKDIRESLGDAKAAIVTSRNDVWLDPETVSVSECPAGGNASLLEDFSLAHTPEFWSEVEAKRAPLAAPSSRVSPDCVGISGALPLVIIQPSALPLGQEQLPEFDSILDSIAVTLSDFGVARVVDARYAVAEADGVNGVSLQTQLSVDARGLHCRFVLHRLGSWELLWSVMHCCAPDAIGDARDHRMLNIVNAIVWRLAGSLMPRHRDNAQDKAAGRELATGIETMFRLGVDNLLEADRCFARAFELEPRGLYLAWRAYVRTYLIAEMLAPCRQSCVEEALAMKARALELEPGNSQALALAAHVEIIARRAYVAALELSERSVELNAANPLAWSTLGIAKCHLGDAKGGLENAQFARKIAGIAPFRFHIDTLACLAGVMSNQLGVALQNAVASHALQPTFKPPLRYMAAIYRKQNEEQQMAASIESLRSLEPDFSFYKLSETSYPSAAMRRSGLL